MKCPKCMGIVVPVHTPYGTFGTCSCNFRAYVEMIEKIEGRETAKPAVTDYTISRLPNQRDLDRWAVEKFVDSLKEKP